MPTQDTSKIKEKILFVIKQRGPSLPVHIARATGLSILFASAFLSELLSERKIKMSHMRVGSSPIYYIQGQEAKLENFAHHLNNKEKEAFTLLQNKKILKDSEQVPAIRVALRSIKDFVIPLKKEEKIFWRYYLTPENQLEISQPKSRIDIIKKTKTLDIFEKPKPTKKRTNKKNDKFFNKVKEFLSKKSIEILDIEFFSKNELVLKIKKDSKEEILIAYNKKRINEEDIIKANKKISEKYSKYSLLCLGKPLKHTKELINSIRNLSRIEEMSNA